MNKDLRHPIDRTGLNLRHLRNLWDLKKSLLEKNLRHLRNLRDLNYSTIYKYIIRRSTRFTPQTAPFS